MKSHKETISMDLKAAKDDHYVEKNPLNDLELLSHSRVRWKLMAANGSDSFEVLHWLGQSDNVLIQAAARRRIEALLNTTASDATLKNPYPELRNWLQKNI